MVDVKIGTYACQYEKRMHLFPSLVFIYDFKPYITIHHSHLSIF